MARKAKKRMHRMPPLSVVDKLIYWFLMLLLCGLYLLLLFGPISWREWVAFSDASVVALQDSIGVFLLFLPWLTFFLMTIIPWTMWYLGRKPIFGKRNFKYGPPAWPKEYPLFMKNKPYVFVSERKKKQSRRNAWILVTILLVSFLPLPFSVYGRECLKNDGSIVMYTGLNQQAETCARDEIESVTIETYHYKNRGDRRRWAVKMTISTANGKKYKFRHRDFRKDRNAEPVIWLAEMLNLKNLYGASRIRYEGTDKLDRVISDQGLSGSEAKMLYALFGQE